ncbi:13725_t:CDS:10 [Entrophospora sp. SA101]|nr:13725_t:CDS:10 [Entrophospora sp. SA101]
MSQWLPGPPSVPPNQYIPPPTYQRPSIPPQSQPPIDDLSLAFDNLAMTLRATAGPQELDDFQFERRQEFWVKDALYLHLLPLLRAAFHFMEANEKQQEKVLKIISIWSDKQFFDEFKINSLQAGVMVPPPPPGGPPPSPFSSGFGHTHYQNQQGVPSYYNQGPPPPPAPLSIPSQFSPPPGIPMQGLVPRPNTPNISNVSQPILTVPEKKYHELPAGLIVPVVSPENPPYTPIHAASIRLPPHRLPPTQELLDAVDKFYDGMNIIESTGDSEDEGLVPGINTIPEKSKIQLDKDGWEFGFLDDYYKELEIRRSANTSRTTSGRYYTRSSYNRRLDDRGGRWSRDNNHNRSYSSRSRSLSISRSQSRRHKRRSNYSDSSRSRSRGRRRYRRRNSRSRNIRVIVDLDTVGGKDQDHIDHIQEQGQDHIHKVHPDQELDLELAPAHVQDQELEPGPDPGIDLGLDPKQDQQPDPILELDQIQEVSQDHYLDPNPDQDRIVQVEVEVEVIVMIDTSLVIGLGYVKERDEGARTDKMISDHNVGFQILKKLGKLIYLFVFFKERLIIKQLNIKIGWEGAGTGLGSSMAGIAEPIKGGELRTGEQKYLGVGHTSLVIGLGYVKERDEGARTDKMISDHNVGFQILKKLGKLIYLFVFFKERLIIKQLNIKIGWEGAGTGLGSSMAGIAEPIKGGELRTGEQKYLGVGHGHDEEGDIFDQYRKQKSYTYQRSDGNSKDKKPAGCFRCGKPGHIARECQEIGTLLLIIRLYYNI